MSKNLNRFPLQDTAEEPEHALLVGVEFPQSEWPLQETLAELGRLADTAGALPVGQITQKLATPNPATFIGSGKAHELAELCRSLDVDVVIFDDELTPSQQSNLEKCVDRNVKIIDRTALILDIFALHAHTREGRLQVRLAQNQYLLPRLRGMWAHLASNRMGGGVGSRFGEGESQLEVDRRLVRKRITSIKRELAELDRNRSLQRQSRSASGMVRIALAGYTNAGKSSLLNRLTDAGVLSYDKLFATLDSTTRKLTLPEGREVTLTDTVGFIQKLPTTLVESFKSTLEEIREADAILHIVDASATEYEHQIAAVEEVLDQIDAAHINRVTVFNKIDALTEDEEAALKARYPHALFISARTGQGVDTLIDQLVRLSAAQDTHLTVRIPYDRGDLVSLAHQRCFISREAYEPDGTVIQMRVPSAFAPTFKPFVVEEDDTDES
ncbi:GTPase HflX [Hugonella massiliensis]|uniref:GTPase HflX n=1 Tax=Hugonella massiliensis TaxID=1720315 RepID=UPI00073F5AC9|nr:GTPase HflX [Hugonella massiliensis]